MKKILLMLFLATGISLSGFSMSGGKAEIKHTTKKTVKKKVTKSPYLTWYCTAVEIYLICGGTWSGNVCHEGIVLTSAMFNSAADLKDLQLCGYTWKTYIVM
jgi:hypothetical protein